jgi:site-specific recombinase XerD
LRAGQWPGKGGIMVDPSVIRLRGPLAPHRDGLWGDLQAQGYTPLSSANPLRLMAHLSRWLDAQRLQPDKLDSTCIARFLRHRRESGYVHWFSPRGLDPVLRYLRSVGVIPILDTAAAEQTPRDGILQHYKDYLLHERSLVPTTASGYLQIARRFLWAQSGMEIGDLGRLSAGDVTSFVLREFRSSTAAVANLKATALRSFLRYLYVRGNLASDLRAAVPSVACRRLAGLPKGLSSDEVRRVLRSCDRRTGVGRRDYAALLLMLRLALRAGEIAALTLDDLDWTQGEIVVRGKPRREDRLPLLRDIGEAVASYLKRGRPRSESRHLLLRARAPHGELSRTAVTALVTRAGQRVDLASLSPHRLRHTVATQMLQGGASLSDVAQVLRHRHIDTTAIYAKVDRHRLQRLGRSWPGGEA